MNQPRLTKRWTSSLSTKLTLWIVLIVVLVMAAGSFVVIQRQNGFYTAQMKQEGDILASSVGLGLSKLMKDQSLDKAYLQQMTEEFGKIHGIHEIIVYDKEGVVIADTDRAWLGQKMEFEDVKQVLETKEPVSGMETMEGKEVYSKTFPIFIEKQGEKEFIGVGEVSMDLEEAVTELTIEQKAEIFARIAEMNLKKIMGDDRDSRQHMQELTEVLGRSAGVYEIMLTDNELRVIANTHPEEVGEIWTGEDVEEYERVLATGETLRYYEVMEGVKTFSITQPIYVEKEGGAQVTGLVEVAMSVPYIEQLISTTRNEIIGLTLLIILAISILLLLLLRGNVISPVLGLVGVTRQMAQGDLSRRAQVTSRDEIGELSRSFNEMAEEIQKRNEELQTMNEELRSTNEELEQSNEELQSTTEELETSNEELKQTQDQLVQKEKLAAVGQLAAGVGHELRNPLGVIKNAVYYIKTRVGETGDPKVAKHLEIMEREVNNSNKIISDLLGFSRTRAPAISAQDIHKVVEEALEVVEAPGNVRIVKELGKELPKALVDQDQIRQVFVNLALNAIQAMGEAGELKITTRRRDQLIETEFVDTGCGIKEEDMPKLFDPFFTTKAKGIGLGLAVTKGIVERHNGMIEIKSQVGKGTTVIVRLPAGGDGR